MLVSWREFGEVLHSLPVFHLREKVLSAYRSSPSEFRWVRKVPFKLVTNRPTTPAGQVGNADDDYSLMARIAQGDRSALDLLYQRYSPVVFSLCLRVVGDRGTAEDLLIDIFFEIWRKSARYDASRGAPLTYISTLARSRAIDRKRTRAGRIATAADDLTLELASANSPMTDRDAGSPVEQASLVERAAKVREALGRLEEEHRKTLELSYFEGLSHSEIAEKLGKPLGTVKTHIRMGVIRMRELLRIDP